VGGRQRFVQLALPQQLFGRGINQSLSP